MMFVINISQKVRICLICLLFFSVNAYAELIPAKPDFDDLKKAPIIFIGKVKSINNPKKQKRWFCLERKE